MFRRFFVVILCILVCSCAKNERILKNKNIPSWVNISDDSCKEGFICSIGEGRSMGESYSNARAEIAKQFSVTINSTFNNLLSEKNGEVNRFTSSNIDESVSEIVEGVEFENYFFDDVRDVYYTFAVLDKRKLASEVKKDISMIDDELKSVVNRKPVNIKMALKLLDRRRKLGKKYTFLTGEEILEKIKKEDVLKAKKEPTLYKLDIVDNENFGLKDIIVANIIDNKDKIDQNATKTIVAKISMEKIYLNVEGFEKYEVDVNLKCKNNDEVIGQSNIRVQETGRNKQQIVDKLKKRITERVNDNIVNLLV